jgi:hypothetical protein
VYGLYVHNKIYIDLGDLKKMKKREFYLLNLSKKITPISTTFFCLHQYKQKEESALISTHGT